MNKKNCSFKKHSSIEAIIYCKECKLYLCNKCQNHHSEIHENHHLYNLDKDINEFFSTFCEKENHNNELKYYCRTHNELCCVACICKIKGQGNGQHKDCDVVFINEVKEEKKNKLKENIKNLENLSNTFQQSIEELKIIFEKINEKKEEIKTKIQKIFTKIRSELNDREDALLLELDKLFNENYCDEKIIKEGEKLPNKIKSSLEKGKLIDKEWNDNELSNMIFGCINIENIIKDINKINENIKKCSLNNEIDINFTPEEDGINEFLKTIKNFGKIKDRKEIFLDSSIITNNEMEKMILNWINPNVNIKFKLLYKVSRDGDRISTFTEKVKGKSPTLIIIESKSGFKFGGYTSVEWNMTGSYTYKSDNSAFIFSIDKKKKYKLKTNYENDAICGDPNHFAFGGGHDLTIWDKCTTNDNTRDYGYNHSYEMKEKYELTGGNKSFYVQECEVYQVLFNK